MRAGFDAEGVRPTFNNCVIHNLHIYGSKHQCEEYYDNVSEKRQQRLRFEREQLQQQQQQQPQQESYVEFAPRDRLSLYSNMSRRRP